MPEFLLMHSNESIKYKWSKNSAHCITVPQHGVR